MFSEGKSIGAFQYFMLMEADKCEEISNSDREIKGKKCSLEELN